MTDPMQHTSVEHPVLKIVSAWLVAVGISSWSDVAAALAALYSLILIGEWCWKRFLRACAERHGLISRRMRRASDRTPEGR